MIQTKQYKCKGQSKAIGFNGCSKSTFFRKYGLCASCLADWIEQTPEGKTYLNSIRVIGSKRVKAKEKKEAKTKGKLEQELQKEVNKIVRLIDFNKGCISCNHGHDGNFTRQAHAGHKLSVGSNVTLRFHLDNIHKQCSICNNHLSGNVHEYYKGLSSRYSAGYANYIETLPSQFKVIKLSKPELEAATKKARKLIREIESGTDYTRSQINNLLNIYR